MYILYFFRFGVGVGGLCYSFGRDLDICYFDNDLWFVVGGLC